MVSDEFGYVQKARQGCLPSVVSQFKPPMNIFLEFRTRQYIHPRDACAAPSCLRLRLRLRCLRSKGPGSHHGQARVAHYGLYTAAQRTGAVIWLMRLAKLFFAVFPTASTISEGYWHHSTIVGNRPCLVWRRRCDSEVCTAAILNTVLQQIIVPNRIH